MRTLEFANACQKLGFGVTFVETTITISHNQYGVVASIATDQSYTFDAINHKGSRRLNSNEQTALSNLLFNYAKTPIARRETPTLYQLTDKQTKRLLAKYQDNDKPILFDDTQLKPALSWFSIDDWYKLTGKNWHELMEQYTAKTYDQYQKENPLYAPDPDQNIWDMCRKFSD